MTAAIFGLIGVVVGSTITALLNYWLQKSADERRWQRESKVQQEQWEREDKLRFQPERFQLYRDFMLEAERTYALERFDSEKLRTMIAEIELLEYMTLDEAAVSVEAIHVLVVAEELWAAHRRGWHDRDEEEVNAARGELERALRNFKRDARKELGTYVNDGEGSF